MPEIIKDSSLVHIMETFREGVVISNVGDTTASTAAAGAVGDQQDANIREINNIVLDLADTRAQLNSLLTRLRDRGIISS